MQKGQLLSLQPLPSVVVVGWVTGCELMVKGSDENTAVKICLIMHAASAVSCGG